MTTESQARNVVRALLKRFDEINSLRLSMAYVCESKDPAGYIDLLKEAERVANVEIQPLIEAEHKPIYEALDDAARNWHDLLLRVLDTSPRVVIRSKPTRERS